MGYNLKIWGDRYAFMAEVKGGSLLIRPKKIVVTSNYHPREIWEDSSTLEPILRRYKIVHFQSMQSPVNEPEVEVRAAYAPNFIPPIQSDYFADII